MALNPRKAVHLAIPALQKTALPIRQFLHGSDIACDISLALTTVLD
jgi:hypothetical protein